MPYWHPTEIKAMLHMAKSKGVTAGICPQNALLTCRALLELINQSQTLHTGDGLGPIKGYALRWGQTEIYVAYIKRPLGD